MHAILKLSLLAIFAMGLVSCATDEEIARMDAQDAARDRAEARAYSRNVSTYDQDY